MDPEAPKRAIIDKVVGAPAGTLPPDYRLDEPWRTIYRRVTRAKGPNDAFSILWFAAEDRENATEVAQALFALLPEEDEAFSAYPSLHEMADDFPPVDWLWPSWVPTGAVTLLAGAPGAGKSLVALDLARRVIHGPDFPDGAPVAEPGRKVLIVDAEGAPDLLTQRAQAWGVDLRRLFPMQPPSPVDLIDLDQEKQRERLINMVRGLRPALIVVDSLAAATSRGETSLQGCRDLLGFLAMIAREARLALLAIHHLRKRARSGAFATPQVAADDLRGSSHLSAAARSVLALTPASPLRLEVLKTNLCRLPPPLALVLKGKGERDDAVPPTGGRQGTATDQRSARFAVPTLHYSEYVEPAPVPSQQDLCARWLMAYLADAGAPVKPADAVRAARAAGYPRPTLYRARKALGGLIVDLGNSSHDPNNRWDLAVEPPATEPPPADDAPSDAGH
jgi:putative DNA primase/helicase